MKIIKNDVIVDPKNCDMMNVMIRAGFSKLHPDGKYSTKKLLQMCNVNKNKRVLDIGCGPGETSIYIAKKYGCKVTGIDIMPEMIKKAKANAKKHKVDHLVSFEKVDAMSSYDLDGLFDIVIFQAVLIFGEKQKMLKYAYDALKKNGNLGAIELTWRNNPTDDTKHKFAVEFAEPLINAENQENWLSIIAKVGFKNVICTENAPFKIKSFIRMWIGESLSKKIKIIFKSFTDLILIKKTFIILGLLKEHPGDLGFGYYLAQK